MRTTVWRFAEFEFSTAGGLSRDGVVVPLQAKPRGILEMLLRADRAVVLKDTIAAALWSHEAPSDASIARAVRGLRKALGDRGSRIVLTVYGEGLQLACSVESVTQDTSSNRVAHLLRTAWEVAESRRPDSYSRAIDTLRYTVATYPNAASAWALLADAFASKAVRSLLAPADAASEIQNCCEKALRADPNCSQALAVSGWKLGLLMGRSDEGMRRLNAATHDDSDWPTYLYRAWLQIYRRDLAGAQDELVRGLAISPFNRSLLDLRAFVTLYEGKIDDAEKFAVKAQEVRDDVDGLWIVRSIVASERGDFVRSCTFAERAAELMGHDRQTSSYLAYAYAKAGKTDRAKSILDKIGPGLNGHTPALLAAPFLALGETSEAVRIIKLADTERCPYRAVTWCDPRLKSLPSHV